MSDYDRLRKYFQDISGSLAVVAATTSTVLASGTTKDTIYVQKVLVQVTGASPGKTWQLDDSASPARQLAGPWPTDTDGSNYVLDFGADGLACTEGKDLVLTISAPGASGNVTWQGYRKQTSTRAA